MRAPLHRDTHLPVHTRALLPHHHHHTTTLTCLTTITTTGISEYLVEVYRVSGARCCRGPAAVWPLAILQVSTLPLCLAPIPSRLALFSLQASDNKKITQATTGSVSPAHTSATYTAKGLLPGDKYAFAVTLK